MMHGREKSDLVVVAVKPTNKAGAIRSGAGGAKDGDQGKRGHSARTRSASCVAWCRRIRKTR